MFDVFLLLGSNLGDRFSYLEKARRAIRDNVGEIIKKSSVYETAAWGKENDPDYLNQVLEVQTKQNAPDLLKTLLEIELTMGRERKEVWAARTIDIDILFFEKEIIDQDNLIVPHPRLHLRRFTLEPLAEIAPDFVHPVLGKTITELKNELPDSLTVKKL
ncbi:2-amino-4-hydroxy-6-hydroxymethyldihydropteridine diphosphokinase [Mucilaginibacter sp. RS28]|uniref:2-amino-4-hydroxy-6-hydroxymethyldihydropteridine pyrophosphokinase n=1 Tax=Mucilaginibacter straminoryzae TaxID=2932774 RepID=A0A9X1X5G7_9SPHI|nr:2-amino-4-hydroxy-6-hydroxymethyldihydropteridine diphosphokinase [Mucilaginibacter straminoryzae]MCJ8209953.1 2-amino-4-hydroxy-6-hydroxymethyldihydropteridine diphosphokinase [Mucilaginibacter straminoryzae]